MNYVALTERLVKALVVDEDMVTVKEFPSDDENKITTYKDGNANIKNAIIKPSK